MTRSLTARQWHTITAWIPLGKALEMWSGSPYFGKATFTNDGWACQAGQMARRLLAALVAATTAAAGLAACSTSGGDRLTIYSGRQQDLILPLLEEFSDETGIGVD